MPPQLHILSPAELSYLRTSLASVPPIRPDARTPTTFRPMVGELDLLPSAHGSSRLIFADGGECIVGIKTVVEQTMIAGVKTGPPPVEISVDIAGARDDDPLATFLANMVAETVDQRLVDKLKIGKDGAWGWRLYIDVRRPRLFMQCAGMGLWLVRQILLLTPPISHPATLLSLATHLALRSTRLPKLISEPNEEPMFDNDWEASLLLYTGDEGDVPAITLLVAAVEENMFFDPTREEMSVADCVLGISINAAGSIIGLRTLETDGMSMEGGVARKVVRNVITETKTVAPEVFEALAEIVKIG